MELMANDTSKLKIHRYQYKAFFWSLGNKSTVQIKNQPQIPVNKDVCNKENEN